MTTTRRGLSLRVLRVALAGVTALDLFTLTRFIDDARRFVDPGTVDPIELALSSPWVVNPIAVVGMVLAFRFAQRAGRLAEAGGVLACLAMLSHVHGALVGSPWRHLYFSGTCLFGWALGAIVARRRGAPEDESLARIGAIATLGAAYANAGLSKLVYGGPAWLEGQSLRYTVVAQDGLVGTGALLHLRELVVGTPAVAAALAVGTVFFELAGPAMLVGPRTRAFVASGLVGMHLSIYVLTSIGYVEAVFLLTLFALPFAPGNEPPAEWGPSRRTLAIVGGALTLVIALSIVREGLSERVVGAAPSPSRVHVRPTRVGPIAVGLELGGSRVDSLEVTGDALVVAMSGPEGSVTFDVTCRETSDEGPWDQPPLHLFFRRTERPTGSLEAPARALAATLGDTPCASMPGWLAAVP
jgi:hypothetical protein